MENTLLTRIQLKYDTLANWLNSSVILMKGELAIAEVPSSASESGLTPPAIGIKVGDGIRTFVNLPWIQAVAGDVYAWAKAPTIEEIPGLYNYVNNIASQYSGGGGGGTGGSGLQYRIIKGTTATTLNKYFLQSSADGSTWNNVSELDFGGTESRMTTLEQWAKGDNDTLVPLAQQVATIMINGLGGLTVSDTPVAHQFVTSVSESSGVISVQRSSIGAADITSGILPVERGGTGVNQIPTDSVLVGNGAGTPTVKGIDNTVSNGSNNLVTSSAVYAYVQDRLGGLTGAMHFIGHAVYEILPNTHDDPGIDGYDFPNATPGDVVLYGTREFVWDGTQWLLLGDESSYVIAGSIADSDIASDAAIQMSKINGLLDALNNKVSKDGDKGLSTNDFTNELKTKLQNIASGAQVNIIESISVTGVSATVNVDPATKNAAIALDLSGVGQVSGAKIPAASGTGYTDLTVDTDKKIILNRMAATGDVADLNQNSGTILILHCGSSTEVV